VTLLKDSAHERACVVLYSFSCRKCGHAWSKGCSVSLLARVTCRSCGHDRVDWVRDASGPPRSADEFRPLAHLQRGLVVLLAAAPSSLPLGTCAKSLRRPPLELKRCALAIPRFVSCDDAGELSLTDLGRVVGVNLRAAGVRS